MIRFRREHAVLVLLLALGLLIGADLRAGRALDPFVAPPPLALWSGEAASGGHCTAPGR